MWFKTNLKASQMNILRFLGPFKSCSISSTTVLVTTIFFGGVGGGVLDVD